MGTLHVDRCLFMMMMIIIIIIVLHELGLNKPLWPHQIVFSNVFPVISIHLF